MAQIEFYEDGASKHIAVVDDGSVPREGDLVNIRKENWRVVRVTWTVDNADDVMGAKLRANVDLLVSK